jgi:hypothetical protein
VRSYRRAGRRRPPVSAGSHGPWFSRRCRRRRKRVRRERRATDRFTRQSQRRRPRAASGCGRGCLPAPVPARARSPFCPAGSASILVVNRDGGTRADETTHLHGVPCRHAITHRPGHREAHATEVQEGGVDLETVGDAPHTVIEHGVARDPQHAVLPTVPAEREADHIAGDRAAQCRAVPARRGSDLDRRPPWEVRPACATSRPIRRTTSSAPRRRTSDRSAPSAVDLDQRCRATDVGDAQVAHPLRDSPSWAEGRLWLSVQDRA